MFGFGKGKIDLTIEKYNFSPGETIRGRISLKLNKPIHAKAVKVGLIGEVSSSGFVMTSGRATTTNQSKRTVFNFEMPLDGEKDYIEGGYDFEMKVPGNLSQPSMPQGVAGDVLKSVQILAGRESTIRWYVIAKLDIPKGIDVSNRVQINIG